MHLLDSHRPTGIPFFLLPFLIFFGLRIYRFLRQDKVVALSYSELTILEKDRVLLAVNRSEIARAERVESTLQPAIRFHFRTGRSSFSLPVNRPNRLEEPLRYWLSPIRLDTCVEIGSAQLFLVCAVSHLITLLQIPTKFHGLTTALCIGAALLHQVIQRLIKNVPDNRPVPLMFEQVAIWGVPSDHESSGLWFEYGQRFMEESGALGRWFSLILFSVTLATPICAWLIFHETLAILVAIAFPGYLLFHAIDLARSSWLVRDRDIKLHVKNGTVGLLDNGILQPASLTRHWSGITRLQTATRSIWIATNELIPSPSDTAEVSDSVVVGHLVKSHFPPEATVGSLTEKQSPNDRIKQ